MSRPGRVGWCPSVATPMVAGDGLLVRVKPPASTLPAAALRAVAEAAGKYGNGLIDLTNRSNLQIRGLRPDTTDPFAEVVQAHGLAGAEVSFEEIRNVAADPLGPDDPDAVFDSHALARAIEATLGREQALRALPPKFGFLVDCGRLIPAANGHADIIVRDRDGTLTVALGGGTSARPCAPEDAPDLTHRLALAFLELAGPSDAPPFRMGELVEAVGEQAVFVKAGVTGEADWTLDQVRGTSRSEIASADSGGTVGEQVQPRVPDLIRDPEAVRDTPVIDPARAAHLALMYAPAPTDSPIGYRPFPGQTRGAVVAGVPRGRIEAATLASLADLSERYADATVRMTPWRALAFVPVSGNNVGALETALAGLGLITDPSDPRRALRGPDIAPAAGANAILEPISR